MKNYKAPEIEVIVVKCEDVIKTSGNGGDGNLGGEIFDDE